MALLVCALSARHVAAADAGTVPAPLIPPRLDPREIPLGLFGIWNGAQWERALLGHPDVPGDMLQREYDRLAATGCTFIHSGIANETRHVRAYEAGRLLPALGVAQAARGDALGSLAAWVFDERIPDPDRTAWKPAEFTPVMRRFAESRDLVSDPAARATAFAVLDRIVDSQLDAYGDSPAVAFYYLLNEGWGYAPTAADNRDYHVLVRHAVDRIRARDRERPIVITNTYGWLKRRARYPSPDVPEPAIVDSVFAGTLLNGWNVWIDNQYPFRTLSGPRERVLSGYAGRYYYRRLFLGQVRWLRELSRDIERYAASGAYTGPRPEWWKEIQVHRMEFAPDGGELRLYFRRPTKYEYAVQAYIAAACGARGFSAYEYIGQPFMLEYTTPSGDTLAPQRPRPERPRPGLKNTHGLIAVEWLYESDSAQVDQFRAPLSLATGRADYFPEGTAAEPYPGQHYPYDRVRDLFLAMRELLPIVRELRWWWALDGLDSGYTDIGGTHGEIVFDHRSTAQWMNDSSAVHDGLTLGERFRLRAISGEDEGRVESASARELYASNVACGLFDQPGDPAWEYYLVVNLRCNDVRDRLVVPAVEETVVRLEFAGDRELAAETVWNDRRRDPRLLPPEQVADGIRVQPVPLKPGDARLIRVRSRSR